LANEDIPASLLAKIVKVYGKLVHFHDFSDMKL
jgi:hypothetical protein